MSKIALGDIRYNAVTSAYEAHVDINRRGRTYRYPCSVQGSLMMEEAAVRWGLTRQAHILAKRSGGLRAIF